MEDIREGLLVLKKLDKNEIDHFDLLDEDIHQILMFALLDSVSEYWPNLALNFLENNNSYMTLDVKDALINVSKAKWASQRFRHRVRHILN